MADPVSRAFARSLLRLRVAKGMSPGQLARACGSTQQNIARIEGDAHGTTITTAHAIAEALDTTIDAMIAEDDLKAAGSG